MILICEQCSTVLEYVLPNEPWHGGYWICPACDSTYNAPGKSINEYVTVAHEIARDRGWWDTGPRLPPEIHMLLVSEIAEATEAARDGKPKREAEELVDCVIRIMDYFGYMNWDMKKILERKLRYNRDREYRHGKLWEK